MVTSDDINVTLQKVSLIYVDGLSILSGWIIKVFIDAKFHISSLINKTELDKWF